MGKPFSININRYDPYKAFRFLVYLGDTPLPCAGVSKVTGLKRSTDVIEYKEGGTAISSKGPGRTKYEPITLERGLTHDPDFEAWANAPQVLQIGSPVTTLKDLRRQIRIELLNENGQAVQRYTVYRCWVSEYQALPDFDANAAAVAIQHIKLENEGGERDESVTEPTEPRL